MPADNPHALYQELLDSRRPELARAITDDCIATIDVYRALPPETALRAIDATLDHLIAAIRQQNIAPMLQWTQERILDRSGQG